MRLFRFFAGVSLAALSVAAGHAQTSNSGIVTGTVADNTGAVIPGATITLANPVSGLARTAQSDGAGHFTVPNLPFNNYHVVVSAAGFSQLVVDVNIRSAIPQTLVATLQPSSSTETVTVTADAGDLLEKDSTFHTDVDRDLISKIPLESNTSAVSSLVTLATPGVAADSNGLFHGLGDHAENSFSVDGQPITDQQSKVFSNQIPLGSIQSLQVISGAPPANYGDKTSLVIDVTTRSGLGVTKPTGSFYASYGSFGTSSYGLNLSAGQGKFGNFVAADARQSGRFLDPPEFEVFHDKGNEENLFDRLDYQATGADILHLNFNYTRSWFQTPNSFDAERISDASPYGTPLAPADQHSKIETVNVAPSWVHTFSASTILNSGLYMRHDHYSYFPSHDPLSDFQPGGVQEESVSQERTLLNAGGRSELEYQHGIHDIKLGGNYTQTFLNENFNLGVVDPAFNAPCVNASGTPVNGFNDPGQCAAAGYAANPGFFAALGCYDLTRPTPSPADGCAGGATQYNFIGHTDVKELSFYGIDNIHSGNWSFNLGIRGDIYNGLSSERQAEPRLGAAYNIAPSNTVLRVSYARTLETPFNENLILSSEGCLNPILNPLLLCSSPQSNVLTPGWRNEFHAGFEQSAGRHFVASAEWISKYTHNGYDFSVLGNTPITFPIAWKSSKIPGYVGRINIIDVHGFSALTTMSSVTARFFNPQIGGAGATNATAGNAPFRIDHDERFNQTTHLQYQPKPNLAYVAFNWRFDSGLVAGAAPCYSVQVNSGCDGFLDNGVPTVNLSTFTGDQEFQAGMYCNGQKALPNSPLPSTCAASQFRSSLISIPAPGTEDDDKNPQRVAPHSLFDLSIGDDNLFHSEVPHWGAQVTVINLANLYSLYNFLSTFSGTHYITPRTVTGQVTYSF